MTKMDSRRGGAGAARDELATLRLTELHPLPLSQSDSILDWRGIKSAACCAAGFRSGLPPLWVITRIPPFRPYVSFGQLRT